MSLTETRRGGVFANSLYMSKTEVRKSKYTGIKCVNRRVGLIRPFIGGLSLY